MTTSTRTATAHSSATVVDDPRPLFARAMALGGSVVAGVDPARLGDPTPCDEYDVRTLLDHLLMVLRRVAALGRGDDPFGPQVLQAPPVADDGWAGAWTAGAHHAQEAWRDDAALTRVVRLPWMQDTGAAALVAYLNEVTVHVWDLAVATGQRPAWDPEVLAVALGAISFLPPTGRAAVFAETKAGMPPHLRAWSDPFADAVPVPDEAPLIERLVAWNGRDAGQWSAES